MTLLLPDPNRQPGDDKHASDTNLIVEAIRALDQRTLLPTGPQGPPGPQGPAGADSTVPGPAGPQGLVGPPGPPGSPGPQGAVGPVGPQGPAGADGPAGPAGPASTVPGPAGATGPQGPAGQTGPQGPAGPKGDPGTSIVLKGTVATVGDLPAAGNTQGDMYLVTATGDCYVWDGSGWDNAGPLQGPKGDTGAQGPQGVQGPVGPEGPQGPQGVQGIKGDTGAAGPKGDTGLTGPQGIQGVTGAQGPAGTNARWFSSGSEGFTDPADVTGMHLGDMFLYPNSGDVFRYDGAAWAYSTNIKGPKGDTGAQGIQGPKGDTGAQGPAGTSPTGTMIYRGDYMPNAYVVGDSVRWQNDLWVCIQDVAAGAPEPANPYWEKAVDVPTHLNNFVDVVVPTPNDGDALVWDAATSKWINGNVTVPPPDLTPYARKDGTAFTGNVTAPGRAPDAGASVRNTFLLTAAPPDTLGADGDIAIVVA